jgi:hypothetical protein
LKLRIASLTLLLVALVAVPAMAQVVYSNGPTNGNTDAWTVNFGFTVSDTFTTTLANTQITGVTFAAWMAPGDILDSAEISITSSEAGGTSYFDQTVNFTQAGCVGNQYGYNVCNESSTFTGPVLASAGSYWLNIQNASSAAGDPVYWDENSGPSSASENTVGTIPSESFTVLGSETSTTSTSTSTTGTTPEPSSIMLFGSGVLGLAGMLRRKLF